MMLLNEMSYRQKEFKVLPPQVRQDIKDRADALHKEMEVEAKKLAENRGFFADDE